LFWKKKKLEEEKTKYFYKECLAYEEIIVNERVKAIVDKIAFTSKNENYISNIK